MEGSRGPPLSFVHVKGATLPGYRHGPFRSPPPSNIHHSASSIQRRNSDGDLSDTKRVRDKCRKYESRFFGSYRSESSSGESGRIISDPPETAASWESPDLAPQFSSRPTITPLAAPASPRPHVRKSFNTFPRPWKARSRSPSPFRAKDTGSKNQNGDTFHLRSFSDSLKQIKLSIGAKREESDIEKNKNSQNLVNNNVGTNNNPVKPVSFYNKVSFFNSNFKDIHKENTSNMYRSVATITVSKNSNSPVLNKDNLSPTPGGEYCKKVNKHSQTSKSRNLSGFPSKGRSEKKELVSQTQQVVEKEREKISESASKYNRYTRGGKLCVPSNTPSTKFSSSASSLPSLPDELGSAPQSSDEENSALRGVSQDLPSQFVSRKPFSDRNSALPGSQGNNGGETETDSGLEKLNTLSGGGGPTKDRKAPLTESNAQSLMQASGRKIVRKRPQIPDKLSRRRSSEDGDQNEFCFPAKSLLSPSHSFSSGVHTYKLAKKNSLPSPVVQNPTKSQSVPPVSEEKNDCGKNRTTVSQILSTLNFARFRLEELTGALGGSKKEGAKSPTSGRAPPSRPPRARHDIEKLKKSTERLKSSDHMNDSELPSENKNCDGVKPKVLNPKGRLEGSQNMFLPKQSIVRTNSSPASTGQSLLRDSSPPAHPLSGLPRSYETKTSDTPVCPPTSPNLLLPPLPSKQRPPSLTRDIPFRSASVSQGDLSNDKGTCSGKASPNLKLYPACKESWGSHTLPRCTSTTQNPEITFGQLEGNELAISLKEFDQINTQCVQSQEHSKIKSKSEVQLNSDASECSNSASKLSETSNVCSKSYPEDICKDIERGSIIDQLLRSDLTHEENISALNEFHSYRETNTALTSERLKKEKKISFSESIIKNNYNTDDDSDPNSLAQCISEYTFEKELIGKSLSSEDLRSFKDICIQTEGPISKEIDKSKKRNIRGSKLKSFEEKRTKFKLHIGASKTFHDDNSLSDPKMELETHEEIDKNHNLSVDDSGNIESLKSNFRKDSNIECRVVEKEPRRSQCLVIRSSSFNRSRDGEESTGREEEASATSECRVVQTRQRLSLEDSEGESTDRDRKCRSLRSDCGDERALLESMFSGSSDSSSQDSVGIHFNKNRTLPCTYPIDENSQFGVETSDENEFRKRNKSNEETEDRSQTKREKIYNDGALNKTNKNLKKQETLKRFNRDHYEKQLKKENSLSEGDSRPNSYSEPECLQLVVALSRGSDKPERKKKHKSDPGFKRSKNDDIIGYFSDSNIEQFKEEKDRQKKIEKKVRGTPGVVSQTSTDSEGRDEFGPYKGNSQDHGNSRGHAQRLFSPPVILSGHDSDTSCQDISALSECGLNRNISRNASPSPYLGDSDSGERCTTRSPHGPRRYPRRPLIRGPYGEMLEAEMSKPKSSSQFLSEDIFLRPRERNSTSPRPSSPVSPLILPKNDHDEPFETSPAIFVGTDNAMPRSPPHSIPASRSLDDSALRLYYSVNNHKNDNHLKPLTNVQFTAYESDSEGGGSLTTLRTGPLHQRTASSPSKLFFEPGTSEDDQDRLLYFAATPPTPKRDAKPTPQPKPSEGETRAKAPRKDSGDDPAPPTKAPKSSKKMERHSKSPKGKKHQEEEARSHASLQQTLKKGVLETEFRSLTEHRHMHRRHRDTRAHIIGEIYDTEKNYVDNLNFLLTRYEQTLRSSDCNAIIESSLVDDIFFQVPEIHDHHHRLLEELKKKLDSRDASICVGDVLLQMLKDPTVAESYKSFVNNWKTAQEATKSTAQAKPAFRNFLVGMAKEHPGKLDLKALLITPVQRFPHYELILKRLLEHTSRDHPDHSLVKEAIVEVQKVAASINDIEQEALQQEQQQFILKEIENFIEGLVDLVQPDRTFLQLDSVTQNSGLGIRKERCLFLFSDILVITSIKRRSATIRKSSSLQLALLSSLESCKLKLFKFIPLDHIEIGRSRDDSMKKLVKELESLELDLQTLSQISRLVKKLHFPKGNLEEALHDMENSLRKQLGDRQGSDSQLSELELNITTQEGIETLTFMFSSAEKRNKWEESLNAAKQKLAMSADRRPPPEFITALPIRKTRAGLQFTCAAHTLGLNAHNLKDVWVCNSDGYVGQVCVMSLQPEPTLACCNGVCNAKILSIASIPAAPHPDSSDEDEDEELSLEDDLRKRRSESLPPEIGVDENDNQQPTMWLGTEDGSIHVYNCNDTIRTKKNKFKFQPGSPVHCIIHIENRVFASLANGNVVVYERDSQGGWNSGERHVVSLSTAAAPVTRMVVAAGKLWCSAANTIRILNINSLQVEHSFTVGGENGKSIACMVCAGRGVWIAMQSSAVIRLHHATTHECVCEVTITSPVTKMLAGCDDIIRQHKLACLKVTALLACKDLLWVGTSAGVIITLPLPHLSHNTRRVQTPPNMVGIPHGHTGNVRFLTSVEMTPESRPSRLKSHPRYSLKGKDHPHHQSGTAAPSKLLVISGGDGYEDFRNSGLSELAGRDDSTNHLLLWQV